MRFDRREAEGTLELAVRLALVSEREAHAVRHAWNDPAIAELCALADSGHLHVKVPAISAVPASALREAGARVEREHEGYVKHAFPTGLHVIVSTLEVARGQSATSTGPWLDHVGIDVRRDDDEVRARTDALIASASAGAWRHVAQGSDGSPVSCCHATVARKHWLFRDAGAPIEVALGPLHEHADPGADLRPTDPAADTLASACCAPAIVKPASGLLRKR